MSQKLLNFQKTAGVFIGLFLVLSATASRAGEALQLLQKLNDYPHAQAIDFVEEDLLDYEVGLGAMQKTGGAWRFKRSERYNVTLRGYTWQIIDGFTSLEVMDELVGQAAQLEAAELMFSCEGRACGKGVQWANRVFHQPLLYGREDLQRYQVYSIGGDPQELLLVYAAARMADRQYLHAQVLQVH